MSPNRIDDRFTPSRNFPEQSERMSDRPGTECEYVPSRFLNPDFSVLDGDRCAYYIWWKHCFESGSYLKADVGYANLYISALLCSDDEPRKIMRKMMDLYENASALDLNTMDIAPHIADLALMKHLLLPAIDYPEGHIGRKILLSEMFSSPVHYITDDQLRLFFDTSLTLDDVGRFNTMLRTADDAMRAEGGPGFFVNYGAEAVERRYTAFGDRVFLDDRSMILRYYEVGDDALFWNVAQDMIRTSSDGDTGRLAKYGPVMKEASDRAFRPRDPEDVPIRDRPGYGWRTDGRSATMNVFRQYRKPSQELLPAIERYREAHAPQADGYIPSGTARADYGHMTPEQYGYYLYWRENVVRGKYPETDNGYVWLFLSETLFQGGPYNVLGTVDRLKGLAEAYEPGDRGGLIHRTLYCFCLAAGLDPPFHCTAFPEALECDVTCSLIGGGCGLEPEDVVSAGRTMDTRTAALFDQECCRILIGTFAGLKDKLHTVQVRYSVHYPKELFLKGETTAEISGVRPSLFTGRFRNFFNGLCEAVVDATYGNGHGKDLTLSGIDCMELIGSVKDGLRAERRLMDHGIDRDKVTAAEMDLRTVTGLMTVEVPEESPRGEIAPDPAPSSTEDPWRDFLGSLGEHDMDYLRTAVGHCAIRHDPGAEKRINRAALGTLGDIIMEDGKVFEEYIGEVRGRIV